MGLPVSSSSYEEFGSKLLLHPNSKLKVNRLKNQLFFGFVREAKT
jgi:hypothetical protein